METLQIAEPLTIFLIDIAAKGTVLLLLALLVTWGLRRSSAAMRHAVWSFTMLSLMLLPIVSWALPAWAIPVLPRGESPVSLVETDTIANQVAPPPGKLEPQNAPPQLSKPDLTIAPETVVSRVNRPKEVAEVLPEREKFSQIQPKDHIAESQLPATNNLKRKRTGLTPTLISFVWVFGVVFFLAVLALCVLKAVVLRRRSEVVSTGDWYRLLVELSRRLRIRRPVELREHAEPIVPLTWGVFRSVVLLPRSAREWAEPMKRTVLLHELAHVRRSDVACQLLGRVACTLFWFHPLAWYGLRRLRQEGEQACDDAVVRSGEKASDYADQLLQVAQFCCQPRGLSLGVAMAEGNSLEVRVKSLFDTTRSHAPVRRSTLSMLIFLGAITLTAVSIVRLVAEPVVAAEIAFKKKPADPVPNVRTRPGLSVPDEWKTQAINRIVDLCPEFGPEHNGLKLGIARPTGQTVFRMGDRIPIELFVMNLGSKETTFQFRCAPRVSYAPRVVDSKGQVVRGISGTTVFQPPYGVALKPGEACSIPVSGLGIGDKGNSNFEVPTAGRYEMSYQIESLKSATMRFNVGKDKAGSFRLDVLDDRRSLRQGSSERISLLKPVFGKAKHGIQMGLAFSNLRRAYSTGETIPIEMFFRNVGATRTQFEFHADFFWSPPTVVNEQGERMPISPIPVWMFEGPTKVTLESGQTFGVSTRGLGLRKGKSGLSLVAPPPGKYRIGFMRTIYDHLKGPGEWQEHLISGTLEIDVRDETNGIQVAKLLPGSTEPLKALEADAEYQPHDADVPPELPVGDLPSEPADEVPPSSETQTAESPEPDSNNQGIKIPLNQVIWWEKADGLQAGFLLDSPSAPNQRIPNNSVAKYRILVRNTTAERLRFIVRLLPYRRADAPFLISSDDITESLAAANLPEKFRAKIVPARFKHPEPAYVISLSPGEAVFVPNQSGFDESSLYVGDLDQPTHPAVSKFRPGMNWIVQPLQIQLFPLGDLTNGTSLMGRYTITRISADGHARKEPASRMVAVEGGKILRPRIQLDVGTLTAAAERNAKDAKWGKVDKGLQCGIRLLNPEPSYVRGDMLEAELLWRNVSATAISTPIPRKLDLYPMVHDSKGNYLPIDFGARFNIYPISLELKAGEVRSLGIFKIKLVQEGTPSPRSNAEPAHLTLKPGTYKLSGSGGVSARDGGSPTSATIDFKVGAR